MDYRGAEGRHAVNMWVDQHLIIEPQDRVVQNCGMKGNAQVRGTEYRAVPCQSVVDAGRKATAYTFFLTPCAPDPTVDRRMLDGP